MLWSVDWCAPGSLGSRHFILRCHYQHVIDWLWFHVRLPSFQRHVLFQGSLHLMKSDGGACNCIQRSDPQTLCDTYIFWWWRYQSCVPIALELVILAGPQRLSAHGMWLVLGIYKAPMPWFISRLGIHACCACGGVTFFKSIREDAQLFHAPEALERDVSILVAEAQ